MMQSTNTVNVLFPTEPSFEISFLFFFLTGQLSFINTKEGSGTLQICFRGR